MSAVIRTFTPFINRELLLQALNNLGCGYTIHGNEIITNRADHFGRQKFVFMNGRYYFVHDSDADYSVWRNSGSAYHKTVREFIGEVERAYNDIYRQKLDAENRLKQEAERQRLEKERVAAEAEIKRMEEERLALEKERQDFVEKQRSSIAAKAKEMGYSVREEKTKGKIKLVLVRSTYL